MRKIKQNILSFLYFFGLIVRHITMRSNVMMIIGLSKPTNLDSILNPSRKSCQKVALWGHLLVKRQQDL